MGPDAGDFPANLEQALFDRRTVLVSGLVDEERAGRVAASLMALDALGDEPVEVRVNAWSDSLDAAFSLMDTIDVLGVRFHATVLGAVAGTMVGVVAVCQRRRIGPSGRVELREPTGGYTGTATGIARHSEALEGRLHLYLHRLAGATGRTFEHLEADHRVGTVLDAEAAVAYGIVDEVNR